MTIFLKFTFQLINYIYYLVYLFINSILVFHSFQNEFFSVIGGGNKHLEPLLISIISLYVISLQLTELFWTKNHFHQKFYTIFQKSSLSLTTHTKISFFLTITFHRSSHRQTLSTIGKNLSFTPNFHLTSYIYPLIPYSFSKTPSTFDLFFMIYSPPLIFLSHIT